MLEYIFSNESLDGDEYIICEACRQEAFKKAYKTTKTEKPEFLKTINEGLNFLIYLCDNPACMEYMKLLLC